MTIWLPDLTDRPGPVYAAIADALADAVDTGALSTGTRLPTHRDLAYGLGVTVGTVSRAYKEAERRGIIAGEVGRGTFVKKRAEQGTVLNEPQAYFNAPLTMTSDDPINMRINCPVASDAAREMARVMGDIAADGSTASMMSYTPEAGLPHHREMMAKWAMTDGHPGDPSRIVVTSGAHHAMTVILSTMLCPGDTLLTDTLTYPGLRYLANLLHLKLKPLPSDEDGMMPEAFEAACRGGGAQAVYLMPTVHNPLGVVMSDARRRELAAIAEKQRVWILEDQVYGYLIDNAPPALTTYAPNVGFYINSTSKLMAAGLRTGFVLAPTDQVARLANGTRITTWMTPPLNAEITSRWIADGTAWKFRDWHRREALRRQQIVLAELKGMDVRTAPGTYHLWLTLPERWRGSDFVNTAQSRGVLITGADQFTVARGVVPDAVRLSYAAEPNAERLSQGTRRLRSLIEDPASAGANFV